MAAYDTSGLLYDTLGVLYDGWTDLGPARSYDTLALVLGPAYDVDGETVLDGSRYFASDGFCTSGTDTPADIAFEGRIANDPEYVREVSCVFWRRQARFGVGSVELHNLDRALYALRSVPMKNRTVQIYRGLRTEPFEDWELAAIGLSDGISFPNERIAVLALADKAAKLDQEAQSELYAGSGNSSLDGNPLPWGFGYALNVPAVVVTLQNGDDLPEYDVHDAVPHEVHLVRSQGVELVEDTGWEDAGNGFGMLVNPFGRITADVSLQDDDGDLVERLPDVLPYLVGRVSLTAGDLDLDRIAALDEAAPYTLNWWTDRPVTVRTVLSAICDSYAGWWWVTRLGFIAVGRLEAPGAPVLVLGEADLVQGADIGDEPDDAPGWSSVCAAQRNWYVHTPAEIADSLTDPVYTQIASDLQRDYRVRRAGVTSGEGDPGEERELAGRGAGRTVRPGTNIDGPGIGTLLTSDTHCQTEATRWVGLYETERRFYTLPVLIQQTAALRLEPGHTVQVQIPDVIETATDLLVIGVRGRLLSARVDIILWG